MMSCVCLSLVSVCPWPPRKLGPSTIGCFLMHHQVPSPVVGDAMIRTDHFFFHTRILGIVYTLYVTAYIKE